MSYILDANVFIDAKNRYYGFDICPGFWKCVGWHHQQEQISSIDRIKEELIIGNDELKDWALTLPDEFFASTDDARVIHTYSEMLAWVESNSQFMDAAKARFAGVADGWLVAYAKAYRMTVVTHEVHSVDVKRNVPIPNLCRQFKVECMNPFQMLRTLSTAFAWAKPK